MCSPVFIGSLYKTFPTDEDDLDTVVSELHDVTEVLKLGLALGNTQVRFG